MNFPQNTFFFLNEILKVKLNNLPAFEPGRRKYKASLVSVSVFFTRAEICAVGSVS